MNNNMARIAERYPVESGPGNQAVETTERRDLESYLRRRLINVKQKGDQTYYEIVCINDENHNKGEAAVWEKSDGTLCSTCKHDSCHGKHTWHDVKAVMGKPPWQSEYKDRLPDTKDTVDGDAELLPSFSGVDASELVNYENEEIDWLVDYILSADQPTVFGAGSKTGKTTQLIDLAVALTSPGQSKWLGEFSVQKRRKVLLITGESNRRAAAKRIGKALAARGLQWSDLSGWLRVEAVEFPLLPSIEAQLGIKADIDRHGIEVVLVDPLYRGLAGVDANKLADMGGAIVSFAKACEPASLVLSHHTTKAAARELGPPSLEDLSGAGLAESCGNWWLLGRNEPYAFDRIHDLTVMYGGRDEQAGIKRIVFNEADWTFEITSGQDLKEQREREADEKRQAKADEKIRFARAQVNHSLTNEKEYRPKTWVETRSKASQAITRRAIAEMLTDGSLIEGDYLDANKKRRPSGLGRKDSVSLVPLSPVNETRNETHAVIESVSLNPLRQRREEFSS